MQTGIDPFSVTVIGVDRKAVTKLEAARFDSARHGEFGANPGDEELINLIYSEGVKQPPAVRKVKDSYEVLDGVRRTLALRTANDLKRKMGEPEWLLPIHVIELCDDLEASITQIELNLNREEDDPISLGNKFSVIVDALCFPADKSKSIPYPDALKRLSKRAKCSESTVRQYINLTQMEPGVQDQIRNKKLGIAAAQALVKLAPDAQARIAEKLISSGNGKNVEAARQARDTGGPREVTKPPKVPASVWHAVFHLAAVDDTISKDTKTKIDTLRIAMGDLPIGHDPELLALVQRVTEVKK
jgi:ParB-like chromosome segregation protein Spo0J